jgi:hypothetical protein
MAAISAYSPLYLELKEDLAEAERVSAVAVQMKAMSFEFLRAARLRVHESVMPSASIVADFDACLRAYEARESARCKSSIHVDRIRGMMLDCCSIGAHLA